MAFPGHRSIIRPDGSTPDSWATYLCGHCGMKVTGATISAWRKPDGVLIKWVMCTNCDLGSVLHDDNPIPSHPFGPEIEGLPLEVSEAYEEARKDMSVQAYTSSELICRKILMHVAVDKGAAEGQTFTSYIDYIEAQGYITPPMKSWVDLIRKHGNEATHRLTPANKDRAEGTIMFTAELLRLVYEMDAMAKKYAVKP